MANGFTPLDPKHHGFRAEDKKCISLKINKSPHLPAGCSGRWKNKILTFQGWDLTGFTLFEVIIVVAIIAALALIFAPVAVNHYQSYLLISERDNLVSLLRRSRALSLGNRNASAHGLYIREKSYLLFEGRSFAGRNSAFDEDYPRSGSISVIGPKEVIFAPLSATTSVGSGAAFKLDINLGFGGEQVTVQFNEAGGISW